MKHSIILKRFFTTLMLLSLVFSPLLVEAANIDFDELTYSTALDSDFSVAINISNAIEVTSAHFIVKYDPLAVVSAFDCGFGPPWISDDEIAGTSYRKIDITMDLCDGMDGFTGDSKLIDLTLHASSTDIVDQVEIVSIEPVELSQACYADFSCDDLTIGSPTQITIGNPDLENPTISILSPTTENTYSYENRNNVLTISGTSSDDILVASVKYTLNGASEETALGTSTWSFDASLVAGENTINVITYDSSGKNSSSTLVVDYNSRHSL